MLRTQRYRWARICFLIIVCTAGLFPSFFFCFCFLNKHEYIVSVLRTNTGSTFIWGGGDCKTRIIQISGKRAKS